MRASSLVPSEIPSVSRGLSLSLPPPSLAPLYTGTSSALPADSPRFFAGHQSIWSVSPQLWSRCGSTCSAARMPRRSAPSCAATVCPTLSPTPCRRHRTTCSRHRWRATPRPTAASRPAMAPSCADPILERSQNSPRRPKLIEIAVSFKIWKDDCSICVMF